MFISFLDSNGCPDLTSSSATPRTITLSHPHLTSIFHFLDDSQVEQQRPVLRNAITSPPVSLLLRSEKYFDDKRSIESMEIEAQCAKGKERERTLSTIRSSSVYPMNSSIIIPESMSAGQILPSRQNLPLTLQASSPIQEDSHSSSLKGCAIKNDKPILLSILNKSIFLSNNDPDPEEEEEENNNETVVKDAESAKTCQAYRFSCRCCICDCSPSPPQPCALKNGGVSFRKLYQKHNNITEPFPEFGKHLYMLYHPC